MLCVMTHNNLIFYFCFLFIFIICTIFNSVESCTLIAGKEGICVNSTLIKNNSTYFFCDEYLDNYICVPEFSVNITYIIYICIYVLYII